MILRKLVKILLVLLICLISLFVLAFGGLNLLKFAIYNEYYGIKQNLCTNPGLSDGFICQGICAYRGLDLSENTDDMIFVSGYMKNDSASRIYVTDLENSSYYVTLKDTNGNDFNGHAGGITISGSTVYIADGSCIHEINIDDILSAENGDAVVIRKQTSVNNSASFIYSDDSYLYVGEFHNGKQYITDHPFETPEGINYAIVSRYSFDNLENPNAIYSIRDKVQGFCVSPQGDIVLSTSYGLTDSYYYVYKSADIVDSGLTMDGAPVYFLTNCYRQIKGPAMAEGLDFYCEKVITLTESASDKYIFGKFFFANKIVSLDIFSE